MFLKNNVHACKCLLNIELLLQKISYQANFDWRIIIFWDVGGTWNYFYKSRSAAHYKEFLSSTLRNYKVKCAASYPYASLHMYTTSTDLTCVGSRCIVYGMPHSKEGGIPFDGISFGRLHTYQYHAHAAGSLRCMHVQRTALHWASAKEIESWVESTASCQSANHCTANAMQCNPRALSQLP